MAKAVKEQAPEPKKNTYSFDDFGADNGLSYSPDDDEEETEEEEGDEEEQEEKPKKKVVAKKKAKEVEEEIEEEEEEEEKPKKGKKAPKKPEAVVEEEEEDSSEASEEEEEGETEDPSEASAKFFEEVEKLTGMEVDVDYGEVDPLTPQGVAIREKAVRESALNSWIEEIEVKYPAAFRALQHAHNGGDIADLFSTAASRDYSKVEIGEKDSALATEILKDFYKARGVKSEAKVLKMIETDQDSDLGLVGEAKAALKELQEEQAAKENEVFESQKVKAAEDKKRDQVMIAAVDEVLESGKLGDIKLPSRQETQDFKKFLLSNIRKIGNGKYDFVTPIEPTNLTKLLQYQYFQFKKGDLGQLIQIKAKSENAKNLRLKLQNEQAKVKRGTGAGAADVNKKMSFTDFTVD